MQRRIVTVRADGMYLLQRTTRRFVLEIGRLCTSKPLARAWQRLAGFGREASSTVVTRFDQNIGWNRPSPT
jgi:hypothetical protein